MAKECTNNETDNEPFKDILNISDNLLDTIMNERSSTVKPDNVMIGNGMYYFSPKILYNYFDI